jgi:threonyl-tRNA synthetase
MAKQVLDEQEMMGRHSLAHVMAKAVLRLFPTAKMTIGPAISDGFYYDFDVEVPFSTEDLSKIEKEMVSIINKGEEFRQEIVTKSKALSIFKNNPYKIELINELPKEEKISLYYLDDDFVDLCRGPHVTNTSKLQSYGFKLAKISGAYWRGSEKNKMLQRIYAYAFKDKKKLAEYLNMLEEAKKRDHRKLGSELELFEIFDEGPGFPFWLPKGMILKNILIDFWREKHRQYGYKEISTPMILDKELWLRSGHWNHYRENMYTTKIDDREFAIKPMNCPGGILVYENKLHSYKDLPERIAELGLVHRHELSGTLHGLMRVRNFTQDDAHIYMTEEQMEDEILNVMKLIDEFYKVFGFEYFVELSTRPKNSMGSDEDWEMAINTLKKALIKGGKEFTLNEGDGAFYGPKIDFHLRDCLGRTWQCGTIQLDFQLPERFELTYVGADGQKHKPIMIHRVVLGSIERFIGILIEHYAGAFPLWLAPVQVKVMNISDNTSNYAKEISNKLRENNIRVEDDIRNEKIGYKIREAQLAKIPYMIIVGDTEKNNSTISIRGRGNLLKSDIKLDDFIKILKENIKTKSSI